MVSEHPARSLERVAIVNWAAGLGAVTAEALAARQGTGVASARSQLSGAERAGLLARWRELKGCPALYTATRAGLRACGARGLDPCRVSAFGARHLIACADVAAALERCYPDHHVMGERELRRDEREHGRLLASARLGMGTGGEESVHRPDLVLWPSPALSPEGHGGPAGAVGLPVAVEVELTVKAPRRLVEICRAWARCRCVAGVLYLTPPDVERALRRAVEQARAAEQIAVVALDAVPGPFS